MRDLALDDLLGTPALLGAYGPLYGGRQRVADGRQRIAQFMREQREELILAPIGLTQSLIVRAQDLFEAAALDKIARLMQIQVEALRSRSLG